MTERRIVTALVAMIAAVLPTATATSQAAWHELPGLSSRGYFAAVFDAARARTFLFGGHDGSLRNDSWQWDGAAWTEVITAHAPAPRRNHSMVYDSLRERVLLYGGSLAVGSSNETWSFDGTDWTLLTPALSPGFLDAHSMAYDAARDRVVLWTGTSSGSLGMVWEFDGANWTQVPTAPSWPQWVPPAALAYDAVTATVALYRGSGSQGSLWRWNGASWTQQAIAATPSLGLTKLVFDTALQRLLLVAGYPIAGATPPTLFAWTGTAWSPLATNGPYYTGQGAVFDGVRQCVVVIGGAFINSTWDSSVFESSGGPWSRRSWAPPSARAGHTIAIDVADDHVVLFGGQYPSQSGDTWERIQGKWELTIRSPALTFPPIPHPGTIRRCRLVHDEARDEFLLLAGCCTPAFPFWRLAGNAWQAIGGTMPPGREDPAVAYDAKRGRVVMFGGSPLSSGLAGNDTWVWDGSAWTELQPVHRPHARGNAGMAYDPLRDRLVLVGGTVSAGNPADTWEFDGTDWHQCPIVGYSVLGNPELVWDRARQAIVAYTVGVTSNQAETWQWNGSLWSLIATATPLPPLADTALFASSADVHLIGGRWSTGENSTIWSLQTPHVAHFTSFGTGSASSVGPMELRGPGLRPWIGETCRLAFGPLPPIALPGLWFGAQRWEPPYDLAPFGWPGREVLVSLDGPLPAVNDGQGGGVADIVVPYDTTFLGTAVHCQAFVFEPLNGELTTSNGLSLTFGAR